MLAELLIRVSGKVKADRIQVLLLGNKKDEGLAATLAASQSNARHCCGRLGLRETIAVVAASDAVVCHSSFGMHVAAAFRKPCVVMLSDWAQFPKSADHQRLWGYPEQLHLKLGEKSDLELIDTASKFLIKELEMQRMTVDQ